MKEYLQALQTQAWRTSGARYNAARRLKRRELFSTVSLAMFSALSIAVAFIQRIYASLAGSTLDNYLTALSVCLGVFLLAISLMEWGAANGAKADALHRNAEDLNAFQRKLAQRLAQIDAGAELIWDTVEDLRNEYEIIKERCSHNHEPLDDLLFRAAHRASDEFLRSAGESALDDWEARWVAFRWHFASVWYFGLFWLVIASALALARWM